MPFKFTLPRIVSSNIYLLVLAAWLVTLSFIVDNYWSTNSNLQSVTKKMNSYVHGAETDFVELLSDTVFANALQHNQLTEDMLLNMRSKPYYLYVYYKVDSARLALQQWSTQSLHYSNGSAKIPTQPVTS